MAHTETYSGRTQNPSPPGLTLPGLAALGKKNAEEFVKAQSDLLSTMHDAHRRWFDRMQSEAKLATDFTHKVTTSRSIPEAVAACQEWTGRRLEMMADDSNHFLTDSRKVLERSARLLSDGLLANGWNGAGAGAAEAAPSITPMDSVRLATEPVSRSDDVARK